MGGSRTPGPDALHPFQQPVDHGTLARGAMPSPGPTGAKGGGGLSKQDASLPSSSADPQEQFRIWIRDALPTVTSLSSVPPFPLGRIVEDYFGSLASQVPACSDYEVMRKYTWYAREFYVHVAVSSGNPNADIHWPGPEGSCDDWSEIQARPLHQRKRVIDCEGYAFIASRLFVAAGWTLNGFRIAYGGSIGQRSNFDYHIAAQLSGPGGSRTITVGTQTARTSTMHDEARAVMRQHHAAMRVLADVFSTQAEAIQAVDQHAQQEGALAPQDEILGP